MEYKKVYDSHYTTWVVGYECEAGYIFKDSHLTYSSNEQVDGWEVTVDRHSSRIYYASTLKAAKKFVEYCLTTYKIQSLAELTAQQIHDAIMAQ